METQLERDEDDIQPRSLAAVKPFILTETLVSKQREDGGDEWKARVRTVTGGRKNKERRQNRNVKDLEAMGKKQRSLKRSGRGEERA